LQNSLQLSWEGSVTGEAVQSLGLNEELFDVSKSPLDDIETENVLSRLPPLASREKIEPQEELNELSILSGEFFEFLHTEIDRQTN
jgi:hypothetical protein